MNRSSFGKWSRRAVWLTLAAVASIGCSPLNLAAFVFGRDELVSAKYPLKFDKTGPKKDKEEVVVLLLPQLAPGAKREFATADRELGDKLARLLPELAKENKEKSARKLKVISPTQVDKFKMNTPRWKEMSAGDIGKKLGADFVLEIYLDKMRLYQEGMANNIYEGRADVQVSIYEVGENGGEVKDRYPLSFSFPRNLGYRDAAAISESEFKKQYLEALASDIAHMHVDSKVGIGISSDGP
jgi:hypothetical protein